MSEPVMAVFAGGTSAEREVSLGSGLACAVALARNFSTRLLVVDADAVPDGIDPKNHVVFSTLHGTFGEDGGMQRLLEKAGVVYAGCGVESSAVTMDKAATKAAAEKVGIRVIPGMMFSVEPLAHARSYEVERQPGVEEVVKRFGEKVVLKPNDQGSSVGLKIVGTRAELEEGLAAIREGSWLVEQRVFGRELAVGVLNGRAMGIVEIRPKSGVYDYESKYTKGRTEYLAPAPLGEKLTAEIRAAAARAFAACGCRDYARVDFMIGANEEFYLLEINTLPGMKEMSLLPMSARCEGLDFTGLVREMVRPALERFHAAAASAKST